MAAFAAGSRSFLSVLLWSAALGMLLASAARGDIVPPRPETHWPRDEAPSRIQVIIAGISISLALALAGFMLVWRATRIAARVRYGAGAALLLAAVATGAFAALVNYRVRSDQQKWRQYDRDYSAARAATRRNLDRLRKEREGNRLKERAQVKQGKPTP